MKFIYLAALAPFAAAAWFSYEALLDGHFSNLQKAQGLTLKLHVTLASGDGEDDVLTLGRANSLRWDTPTKTVVSDGKTLVTYDKKAKLYVTSNWSKGAMNAVLNQDSVWAWSAFFNADFKNEVGTARRGAARQIDGVAVTELILTRNKKSPMTLMIDDKLGVARVATYEDKEGSRVIVKAAELTLSDQAPDAKTFTWVAPEGAREKPAEPEVLYYADVRDLIDKMCVSCHSGDGAKAGIDLSSYDSIINANVVVAGDPDSSKMILVIRRGKMPPRKAFGEENLARLEKWVKSGAKAQP